MHVLQITTNHYAIHSLSKKELVYAGTKNVCYSYCDVAIVANGTGGPRALQRHAKYMCIK